MRKDYAAYDHTGTGPYAPDRDFCHDCEEQIFPHDDTGQFPLVYPLEKESAADPQEWLCEDCAELRAEEGIGKEETR